MTTLTEAAYNILNIITGGHSHNNERYSIEQIKYIIEYYRSLFIRRDLSRESRTYELEQDLGLLPVEIVDPGEASVVAWRGLTFRTIDEIPTPIRLSDRNGITSVTTGDMRYQFPIIEYHMGRWQRYNEYTPFDGRSFLYEGRIYITTTRLLDHLDKVVKGEEDAEDMPERAITEHSSFIKVRGIFERPKEAWEFANPGREFNDDTDPYPLSKDLEQRIAQAMLSGEITAMLETPHDIIGDLKNDTPT